LREGEIGGGGSKSGTKCFRHTPFKRSSAFSQASLSIPIGLPVHAGHHGFTIIGSEVTLPPSDPGRLNVLVVNPPWVACRNKPDPLLVPFVCHIPRGRSRYPADNHGHCRVARELVAPPPTSLNASRGYAWVENDSSPEQTRSSLIWSTRRSPPPRSSGRPRGLDVLPTFIVQGGRPAAMTTDKDGGGGSSPPRPTTPPLTSGNAGRMSFRSADRFSCILVGMADFTPVPRLGCTADQRLSKWSASLAKALQRHGGVRAHNCASDLSRSCWAGSGRQGGEGQTQTA
jgi:hypothetical protein